MYSLLIAPTKHVDTRNDKETVKQTKDPWRSLFYCGERLVLLWILSGSEGNPLRSEYSSRQSSLKRMDYGELAFAQLLEGRNQPPPDDTQHSAAETQTGQRNGLQVTEFLIAQEQTGGCKNV